MGKWNDFAEELRPRLLNEGPVTMSIDAIIRETGTTDKSIRQPHLWKSSAKGTEPNGTLYQYGIRSDFTLYRDLVDTVRFWHEQNPPPDISEP